MGTLWFMKYTHLCAQATTLTPKEKKKPAHIQKGLSFFREHWVSFLKSLHKQASPRQKLKSIHKQQNYHLVN